MSVIDPIGPDEIDRLLAEIPVEELGADLRKLAADGELFETAEALRSQPGELNRILAVVCEECAVGGIDPLEALHALRDGGRLRAAGIDVGPLSERLRALADINRKRLS